MVLTVHQLDENQFSVMENEWQRCLHKSDANRLFMSWPWLYTWWETWAKSLGLKLLLFGVYDEDSNLVGIGPFFQSDLKMPIGPRVRRVHMIGNAWRIAPTVRTEYCQLIVDRKHGAEARFLILEELSKQTWDEMVLCDVTPIQLERIREGCDKRIDSLSEVPRVIERGVRIDASGKFQNWLSELGSNTRLKAYNRRQYLLKYGDLEVVELNQSHHHDVFFSKLNQFHVMRWGKPAFDQRAMQFHGNLIERLPNQGMTPVFSEMRYNGELISVLYDIKVGGVRHNLQSGYLENFDTRVSLGLLHLGFAVESSFEDLKVHTYDLLAGAGKRSFYKSHFKGADTDFHTIQLVRNGWLKFAYSKQRWLPVRWRRKINVAFRL